MNKKPVLSIGIIFKNEIRCIERCLKALAPLREALHCELVMADTGSEDGSREIAERYADVLFDFPWINDFAAARNAVMDRCTGKWLLSIDCDEYMDPDISELVNFVTKEARAQTEAATVVVRNYMTEKMDNDFSDFQAGRLLRMSTGARWEGTIHEAWRKRDGTLLRWAGLPKTIFHHDGYVGLAEEEGKEKRKRNLQLLRKELEKTPDDLVRLSQYIESGGFEPDLVEKTRHAVELVKKKRPGWKEMGASVLRHGVLVASVKQLPEKKEWAALAEENFPNSYYTRIDITARLMLDAWNEEKDYAACIKLGERYLQAYEDLQNNPFNVDISVGVLSFSLLTSQKQIKTLLAYAYVQEDEIEKAFQMLKKIDFSQLDAQETLRILRCMLHIHFKSEIDTAELVVSFWDGIAAPVPTKEQANMRKRAFYSEAGNAFVPETRKNSRNDEKFVREPFTLFEPLEKRCETGRAAVILKENDSDIIEQELSKVECWDVFPIYSIIHAMNFGVSFPLPNMKLNLEEMDMLTLRISRDKEAIYRFACSASEGDFSKNWQDLAWTRGLIMSAVKSYEWEKSTPKSGMVLAESFAKVEKEFLPRYYAAETFSKENICVLPALHRFGWYCVCAFEALQRRDTISYVHYLRDGISACEEMKPMVEFLMTHTPELKAVRPDPELLELAEKVRGMLSIYPADDPAVIAIKASPVYQRVAHLIEEDVT